MATRFAVALAHAGCGNTGFVVWGQRKRAGAPGRSGPVMLSLPRGFVSLDSDDGSIEVVCAGCRQTVASAACGEATSGEAISIDAAADQGDPAPDVSVASDEPGVHEAFASAAAAGQDVAGTAASGDRAAGRTSFAPFDAATPFGARAADKVRPNIDALFNQAEDVEPTRGDAIPPHLFDKLHHPPDRMRQRRG